MIKITTKNFNLESEDNINLVVKLKMQYTKIKNQLNKLLKWLDT